MTKEVKIVYRFAPEYRESYANGCYGGFTPKGEIMMNFFTECSEVPESETYELNDNGSLGSLKGREPENVSFIRSVNHGVVLSKETAKEIYAWLGHILEP